MAAVMSLFILTVGHRNHQLLLLSHMLTYIAVHFIMLLQIYVVGGVLIRFDMLTKNLRELFMLNDLNIKAIFNEDYTLKIVQGSSLVYFELIKVMKYSNIMFGWAVSIFSLTKNKYSRSVCRTYSSCF